MFMKEKLIKNLEAVIFASSLTYAEQMDFLLSLAKLDKNEQEFFVSLFQHDSSLILQFYKLLQKKKLAMEQRNHKLWQEIIKEEIELIKKSSE